MSDVKAVIEAEIVQDLLDAYDALEEAQVLRAKVEDAIEEEEQAIAYLRSEIIEAIDRPEASPAEYMRWLADTTRAA